MALRLFRTAAYAKRMASSASVVMRGAAATAKADVGFSERYAIMLMASGNARSSKFLKCYAVYIT